MNNRNLKVGFFKSKLKMTYQLQCWANTFYNNGSQLFKVKCILQVKVIYLNC